MHVLKRLAVAGSLVASAALSTALALPAHADTAAVNGDVVGVGSDTVQNAADFAFDGAPGVSGAYNPVGNLNRAVDVFATGDANGRLPYDGTCGAADSTGLASLCNGTSNQPPNALAGSVILRAGTKPVIRPNGSGAGIKALVADATNGYQGLPARSIQFARASRLPQTGASNDAEIPACDRDTTNCNGLHVLQFATDGLAIAHVKTGYDGPANGMSAATLAKIYECTYTKWGDIPGYTGPTPNNTIHPLIPQAGSGTLTSFNAALLGADPAYVQGSTCGIRVVQEHDPTGIYADNSAADAIEPFSLGKLKLINSGYFANGVAYKGSAGNSSLTAGAYTPNYLSADTGSGAFQASRGLYFVVRQQDFISTKPFQDGVNDSYVAALFTNTDSAIRSASGKAEISAAGLTPAYKDCGVDPATC